jgi:hypothetical protein
VKRALIAALLCAVVLLADAPRINRAAVSLLEGQVDKLFASGSTFIIEGNTRGIYLDGYGAVFTTMVSVPSKVPSPFNDFSKKDIMAVRETKLKALPALRDRIQQSLLVMASSPALDSVRPNEQVVCGVMLFYYSWEDTHGLPREITMQAEKQKLLGVQNGRVPKTELASLLKVQEQ